MNKNTKVGKCKLCLKIKELNFEHIPPRSAFNKKTKYYIIDQTELYKKAKEYTFENLKPKSKKEQGGIGNYSFCEDCNGFLGSNYVRTYKEFAQFALNIIESNDINAEAYEFDIKGLELLKFLKQITAIFIASNSDTFAKCYPELLEFVKNENLAELNTKYRFYMYLNNEGQNRNGTLHYTNTYGAVCDFTFKPFGFVLNIDNPNKIIKITEITDFKNFEEFKFAEKIPIILNKYPTYYPFPLDFRTKDELNGCT